MCGSHGWRIVGFSWIVQKLGCAPGLRGKVKWPAVYAGASPRAGALFDKACLSGYLCGFCKRGAA
ncbi:hypothetical protein UUC_05361 [Rhodanobacter denitrificans]|nr:hypothetical protein UUC_05361 [Rhodanobacter denitrificans]